MNLCDDLVKEILDYLPNEDIFKFLRKHPDYRSQVFDLVNMLPVLCYINY